MQNIGRKTGLALRQGEWLLKSAFGSGPEAIRAEEAAGKALASAVLRDLQVCRERRILTLVNECGGALTACLTNRERHFDFFPLRMDSANAFALPGGFIFISDTIIDLCDGKEEEVSAILAHEIGHVVCGHAYKRMLASTATNIGTRLLTRSAGVHALLSRTLAEYLEKDYSRGQEEEADTLALFLLRGAGHDPRAMIRLMRRLRDQHGEKNGLLKHFSTHPSFSDRIAAIEQIIAEEKLCKNKLDAG